MALLEMSDDQLKDIGLSRADAYGEAYRPFWIELEAASASARQRTASGSVVQAPSACKAVGAEPLDDPARPALHVGRIRSPSGSCISGPNACTSGAAAFGLDHQQRLALGVLCRNQQEARPAAVGIQLVGHPDRA